MFRTLLIAFALVCLAAPVEGQPVARITGGAVEGRNDAGLDVFLGVPYGAPPVGELRWRGPQPVAAWSGARTAQAFGPSCMQAPNPTGIGPWTPEFFPQNEISEDCLYLNVWTPSARSEPLPVFVWVPGGGFRNGGGAVPVNDGAALAREGVVVITLNYRVGAFGFLVHPALAPEADGGVGNYGLRDIIAALHWVQANAAAFGGDPARVTLAGQSAGGAAVNAMLVSPAAEGLFHRAIVQSSPLGGQPWGNLEGAQEPAARFAAALNATTAAQLRAAPADAALTASDQIGFRPVVDGMLVPADPARAVGEGRFHDVALMTGITAHETRTRLDLAGLRDVSTRYGADAATLLRLYPATSDAEALEAALAIDRERTLAGLQRWAAARARHARTPMYLYLWDYAPPGPESALHRAFHSSEMPYMFGAFAPERPYDEEDRAISARMLRTWANFARSGDPNDPGQALWPAATGAPAPIMGLGSAFAVIAPLSDDKRALFERSFDTTGAFAFR